MTVGPLTLSLSLPPGPPSPTSALSADPHLPIDSLSIISQ